MRALIDWRLAGMLVVTAIVVGSASATLLWCLDRATRARFDHPWLLYALPLAGAAIGLLYHYTGQSVERGNRLIVEQLSQPGGGVPWRMAPMITFATVVTHLFGGSAGREGTAVQMGGSLASAAASWARLDHRPTQIMMMGGVAAGFGAVFGTPLAGAVFAIEVLALARIDYAALAWCLVAGLIGDWACRMWGTQHGVYPIHALPGGVGLLLPGKAALAGIAFGLVGWFFIEANHRLSAGLRRVIRFAPARALAGGIMVIALTYLCGTRAYLGLGVWSPDPAMPTILRFFTGPADDHSWALKLVFTVVTLASGFKGGEVTPLFFIGAALGSALAGMLGLPIDLCAGLGFVAVFAGAAKTPLAGTIMGAELFGLGVAMPVAVACMVARICSGPGGLYRERRPRTG